MDKGRSFEEEVSTTYTSPVLTSLCTSIIHPMDDVKCCACRCKIGVIEEMLFLIETPRPQSIADGEYDCNHDQRVEVNNNNKSTYHTSIIINVMPIIIVSKRYLVERRFWNEWLRCAIPSRIVIMRGNYSYSAVGSPWNGHQRIKRRIYSKAMDI